MIHVVGKYGAAGGLKKGLDYCYGELDHNKNVREEVTHLRGNPEQLFELEKTLTTKNTYVHTSLSFTEKEADMLDTDPDRLDAIMDDYVEQMAVGLPSPDRLPYIAVKHRDPEKFHVEFLFLRMDLETGKSYQPFVKQRGDTPRLQDWNVTMQDKHGLENPNSIEHQKTSTWSKNLPKQVKAIRDEIDDKISAMVEANQINNRQQIIDYINKTEGMEVARVIPSAISIKVEGQKTNIKLKGALYADTFTDIKSVRQAMERRAEINVEQSKQRLQESMQKFAKASHHKYEKSPLDVGVNPIGNKPNNIGIGTDMDLVSTLPNEARIQNGNVKNNEDDRRPALAESQPMPTRRQRAKLGATREEIKTPTHKIFNNVQYNQGQWHWQGSYGFAQVTETENGYSISHGNKMEWQMAAELLKNNGASYVSLTCSTEQSMYRAIKAHAEAGLKISNIILDGQQLPIEQIKDMVKQHDNAIKINSNKYVNSRVEQEGQTSEHLDAIQHTDEHRNKIIERQIDNLEQSSNQIESIINRIESDIEQQLENEIDEGITF